MVGPLLSRFVGVVGLVVIGSLLTPAAGPPREQAAFGTSKLWSVHVDISTAEFTAMQPRGGFGFPGGPAPPKQGGRASERNLFGVEFPWAEGKVTLNGTTFARAGLRYDGNATYFASASDIKRPVLVELGRHQKQHYFGLSALSLHPGSLDPSRAREALAYAALRAAGLPAPRTAFAEVTLTVPGRFNKELVGTYLVVEPVDRAFLMRHFGSDQGLLMRPQRMRGLDYLGEDWERYKGSYQPATEATREQAKRVMAFAKLVNEADDREFGREIGSYVDVDGLLKFLAVNALLSNTESFFALGHNYSLYLEPTGRFVFLPGDMELALANFRMMGTPEQQTDLSVIQPYPGPNKLADRLLAVRGMRERYLKLVRELTRTSFTRERILKELGPIEALIKGPLEREQKAVAARRKGPGGFGAMPGADGGPPAIRKFLEGRLVSVESQLSGRSKGYVPKLSFGGTPPPAGGGGGFGRGPGGNQPVPTDSTIKDLVQVPSGFEVTLFGAPPTINYPVTVSALPTGEVYIAIDEQGSLGKTRGGGRVVRCIAKEGKATEVKVFARMEHPRGLIAQGKTVYVLHPPLLTAYHDDDGDGVADRQTTLVTGLTTDMISSRGGDHTTNGIRMGIDGWIYIAVGDYGMTKAKGKDGSTITMRGGVARVRPDGTELEVYATGLRNPFDLAIDPFLNLFTRDNTNDGAGWDTRISHIVQTANYGYTQMFLNFSDEIMPTMGAFGQGGGTGALYLQDPQWPEKYRNDLYTGDWGRSEVYRHHLEKDGPTFRIRQEVFLKVPRATGMDSDGNGNLYVCSWRGGEASVHVGPNVGFVAQVSPRGLKRVSFPDLKKATTEELLGHLVGDNAVVRLHAQREVLRRGRSAELTQGLVKRASDSRGRLEGRVAAVFTLKQLDGVESHPHLLKLAQDGSVREFALRALTDRKTQLKGVDGKVIVAALSDESPRVRGQALISLGRLGEKAAAGAIVPLTMREKGSTMPTRRPAHAQPDAGRVVPHLAMNALREINGVEACVEALDGEHREGALRALRGMHSKEAVDGLLKKLATTRETGQRRDLLATLIRLYHREAEYRGTWWGIRPDTSGPYYERTEWEQSSRIGAVIVSAAQDGDTVSREFLRAELSRHRVVLKGLPGGTATVKAEQEKPIVIQKADPKNPNQIGNMKYETVVKRALSSKGVAERGKALFTSQSCVACHTTADGQVPKGPHLVDIGKRYKTEELLESVLKPSAKIAQGFETWMFTTERGLVLSGFVVSESAEAVQVREQTGVLRELKRSEIEKREKGEKSMMPDGLVDALTPEQLADLIAYLQSLK